MYPRMTLNFCFSYLHLPRAESIGVTIVSHAEFMLGTDLRALCKQGKDSNN